MRLKREMNARTSNVERGKGRVGPIVHSRSETTRKSSGKDEESREDFEFFGEDACSEKVLRRVTGEEDLRTVQVLFLTVDTNIVQVTAGIRDRANVDSASAYFGTVPGSECALGLLHLPLHLAPSPRLLILQGPAWQVLRKF